MTEDRQVADREIEWELCRWELGELVLPCPSYLSDPVAALRLLDKWRKETDGFATLLFHDEEIYMSLDDDQDTKVTFRGSVIEATARAISLAIHAAVCVNKEAV